LGNRTPDLRIRFLPFADLDGDHAPAAPGVYVVVWPGPGLRHFLPASPAGWFKRRDPSVPISVLQGVWVAQSPVLYIGKASGGATGRRGIRKRLDGFAATVKVNLSAIGVGASYGS
jgi:hypothetical protein